LSLSHPIIYQYPLQVTKQIPRKSLRPYQVGNELPLCCIICTDNPGKSFTTVARIYGNTLANSYVPVAGIYGNTLTFL